jgi:hypothetical protein
LWLRQHDAITRRNYNREPNGDWIDEI